MALRFRCPHCQQLLKIARRKAGTQIQCPRCDESLTVPTELEAARDLAREALGEHGDDQTAAPSGDLTSVPRPTPRSGVASLLDEIQVESLPPLPARTRVIVFPRYVLWLQGALILAVAVVSFAGGYLLGRGRGATTTAATTTDAEKPGRGLIEGTVSYDPGFGEITGDQNAVVLALPRSAKPQRLVPIRGLRPAEPPPGEASLGVQAIRSIGGDYTRAGPDGRFTLVVPAEGEYYVLAISRNVPRPERELLDEVEIAEIGRFFQNPESLVGSQRYRWMLQDIRGGAKALDVPFGSPSGD
ncbi:MAG: hypothetical protein ACOY3P_22095, partial [Planctomycetota bacterium]